MLPKNQPISPYLLGVIVVGLLIAGCNQITTPTGPSSTDAEPMLSQHAGPPAAPGIQGLNAVRNTTEEYKTLSTATADGYRLFSPFVPNMGFHYLHESAINEDGTSGLDRRLNRTKPEILVYADTELEIPQQFDPHDEDFAAVEYAIPKKAGETEPPQSALALFNNADAHDWHVHPSAHELGLGDDWTVHGECHYESGTGVLLAENPSGSFVRLALTPSGPESRGDWNGNIAPGQCPPLSGESLLIVHGKWWTLHGWIWLDNPEGVFHATHPDVKP